MQTVLLCDQYTDPSIKSDFYSWLERETKISQVTEVCSYDRLRAHLPNLESRILFFNSPYIRIPFIREKVELLKNNDFKLAQTDKTAFFFYNDPNTKIVQDSIYVPDSKWAGFQFYEKPEYVKPKLDKYPRIILYSHNRDNYLKLTLDSLLNSLKHCPEIPVSILLNSPTERVLHVALEKQAAYPQVDVLLLEKNCAFAAMNVAWQWYPDMEIAVIAEDDFLLPDSSSYLFPVWPYEFLNLLNRGFDMVGWRVSMENIPYGSLQDWAYPPTRSFGDWLYTPQHGNYPLMAQLLMVRKDFWFSCYDPLSKATFDTHMLKKARAYASPFLPGYHIGFNQTFNGYGFNKGAAFNLNFDEVTVTSLKTHKTRKIKLSA